MRTKLELARGWVPAAIALLLLLVLAMGAWAQTAALEKSLVVGASEVMDFSVIKRAAVSDPSVADYVVLSAKQLMLTGKTVGATDLYVWDDKGQHKFRVVVKSALTAAPEVLDKIREAIANPAIKVSENNGVIILEGEVPSANQSERAAAIASAYAPRVNNLLLVRAVEQKPAMDINAIQAAVGPNIRVSALAENVLLFEGTASRAEKARMDKIVRGLGNAVAVVDMVSSPAYQPRQILVHVKVIDIDRSAERDIGVTWGGLNEDGTAHDQPFLFGEASTGPFALDEGGPFRRLEGLSARLQALVTTNRARVLAEPNLLVAEGESADILVGGEIPIPVVQSVSGSGAAAAGAVTVEWKEFGVKLGIKGTVGEDEKTINLSVSPEVSNLDFGNAIEVSGIVLPALRTRRANTKLHMGNQQTLVIGGLYQTEISKNIRKIPLLGDIPIIGELFKRTDKQKSETELLILVTPEIMTEAGAATRVENAEKVIKEIP